MTAITGLAVYPENPRQIGDTIRPALEQLRRETDISLDSWEENDIAGRFIVDPILERIGGSDLLAADITRLNFNVTFEIGYAIGRGRRVFLIRNRAFESSSKLIRAVGIFDTLGYEEYTNSEELASILGNISDVTPLRLANKLNKAAPVYLVLPRFKMDKEIRIVSRLKKARLPFRSFDPEEHGRLSAAEAIDNVVGSLGVVTLLLPQLRQDSVDHNYRAAFVAGLALGQDKPLLLLQDDETDPVPLDYRDLVKPVRFPDQIDEHLAEFAPAVTERLLAASTAVIAKPRTFLESLSLGASSAENEFHLLGNYYLETDEYHRAARGEVSVVAGRKGVGKSALFFRLRDNLRRHPQSIVLDLKPEGFQLVKFRERVLDYLEEGARQHTITAFWEYLLLLEVCLKLLEEDETRHLRDHRLFEPYRELAKVYYADESVGEGDFSERMLQLTQRIADDFEARKGEGTSISLSTGQVTEILYKHDVAALRDLIIQYLGFKKGLWILFDNLDKGWPPHGIKEEDVLTIRCLIEALGKLELQLRREDVEAHALVFIRNDVYELLVAASPDRGKVAHVTLDWTDPDLLREMLRRRIVWGGDITGETDFDDVWRSLCVSHIRGEESSQYMIDRCLMRPRALIEFVSFCRSHAVNLRHGRIEQDDIIRGEEAFSSELLNNVSYEIQDVFGNGGDLLYEFIEAPIEMGLDEVEATLAPVIEESRITEMINLLLWFGFLGVVRDAEEATFIFDVKYDLKRLTALLGRQQRHMRGLLRRRDKTRSRLRINPAFWSALEVQQG